MNLSPYQLQSSIPWAKPHTTPKSQKSNAWSKRQFLFFFDWADGGGGFFIFAAFFFGSSKNKDTGVILTGDETAKINFEKKSCAAIKIIFYFPLKSPSTYLVGIPHPRRVTLLNFTPFLVTVFSLPVWKQSCKKKKAFRKKKVAKRDKNTKQPTSRTLFHTFKNLIYQNKFFIFL